MKKSKQVALLITGSVVLAACRHQAPPVPHAGNPNDWSSGSPSPSPSPTPSHRWWGHPGGWFFWGGSRSSGSSSSWGSSNSPSHSSGVSRGGFGSHGSSSGGS